MESNINNNPTTIRDNNGKVLGTKRQKPTTKPVIKKPLTNTEMISNEKAKSPVTTTFPTASDRYLQQQEKLRQIENVARQKATVYRPLDNKVKGGFERAIDKMHQLGKTKAELAERSAKMAEKFAKFLEFCKKYGKSIKA